MNKDVSHFLIEYPWSRRGIGIEEKRNFPSPIISLCKASWNMALKIPTNRNQSFNCSKCESILEESNYVYKNTIGEGQKMRTVINFVFSHIIYNHYKNLQEFIEDLARHESTCEDISCKLIKIIEEMSE
jgi:hypothetical protein